jgi:hypothetical protein
MTGTELLVDAFGRIHEEVQAVVDGLDEEQLAARPDPDANSIAWLVWHLSRVQDDHVLGVLGEEQVYTAGGWVARFGLPFDPAAHGYGHTSKDVAAVRGISAQLLAGYQEAVHQATVALLGPLGDADYDRVVDERWDPPVTLGVRLVSVLADGLQHVGQAAYVRGLIERG